MAGTTGGPTRSWLREVGAELRELREAAGMTQRELAKLAYLPSHARVSQMETGKRLLTETEMERVLDALGVDPDMRNRMVGVVREVQGPGRLTSGLPSAGDVLDELIQFERDAKRIVDIAPLLVPGLLQTSAYARAIMSSGPDSEKRVTMRAGRRDVLTRRRPVDMVALIDSEVLSRPIVQREDMDDQLRFLLEMGGRGNVTIQLVNSNRSGWHPGLSGPFELMEFPKAGPVVHLEHHRSSLFLWDPDDVREFVEAAEEIRRIAMTPEESAEVVKWLLQDKE